MTWQLWTVVGLVGLSSLMIAWNVVTDADPTERTQSENRAIRFIAFLFQAFVLYAILNADFAKKCFVE